MTLEQPRALIIELRRSRFKALWIRMCTIVLTFQECRHCKGVYFTGASPERHCTPYLQARAKVRAERGDAAAEEVTCPQGRKYENETTYVDTCGRCDSRRA